MQAISSNLPAHKGKFGARSVRSDGENISAARSNFMVEHKFISSLDYTTQLIGNNDTRFSLVYVRKSGEPYSVTLMAMMILLLMIGRMAVMMPLIT